jgi:hypothetical protein
MDYSSTHHFIKVRRDSTWPLDCPIIKEFRQTLGDNRLLQPLQERPWFTDPDGVWIRHDCLNYTLITWLVLKGQ